MRAAEQGDVEAQLTVARAYCWGNMGLPQNGKKAMEMYMKLAQQGHPVAQCGLGDMYSYGLGIPRNIDKAKEWFQKAAEQGDRYGETRLRDVLSYHHNS